MNTHLNLTSNVTHPTVSDGSRTMPRVPLNPASSPAASTTASGDRVPAAAAALIQARLQSRIEPHFSIFFEKGAYLVKTVSEPWEIEQVLKLRYEVFMRENGAAQQTAQQNEGWDVDEFDTFCDHLIIVKKAAEGEPAQSGPDRVVGTYRLICSTFSERFYSQTEFELAEFLKEPGVKLELGRACIDPEFRKGSVMNLLWRGVSEYLRLTQAKFLFGCSSLWVIDTPEVASVYCYLESKGALVEKFQIHPQAGFECPGLKERLEQAALAPQVWSAEQEAAIQPLIPPLLEMYLLAGAKVIGRPALDRDFGCVDFLTVLDTAQLSPLFSRRYQGASS